MRVRADIEMDLDQILKAVNAEDIAEFIRQAHRLIEERQEKFERGNAS